MLLIEKVYPNTNYQIEVLFNNGEKVVLDFTRRIKTIRFSGLEDELLFSKAETNGSLIMWGQGIEISVKEILEML